eukprot:5643696-Amphidinium_carterae.1
MYPNYSFKPESGETMLSRIEIGRAMIEIGRAMRESEQSLRLVRLIHVRPMLWIWTQSDQVSARCSIRSNATHLADRLQACAVVPPTRQAQRFIHFKISFINRH